MRKEIINSNDKASHHRITARDLARELWVNLYNCANTIIQFWNVSLIQKVPVPEIKLYS